MLASAERPQQCIMLKLTDANVLMWPPKAPLVSFTAKHDDSSISASIQMENKHE